ncbi:MAG: hypothetical protein HY925_01410 [Elusimicrobia bacterium]|nr:hypothetical protein [Elusimicrobiota bacterium]
MTRALLLALLLPPIAAAALKGSPEQVPGADKPAAKVVSDESTLSQLLERAQKAGKSKDRKSFSSCLTGHSRSLFGKVFPENDSWEPVGVEGRKSLKVLEVRRHPSKPWAMAVLPAKTGDGKDGVFARKESGRWALDQQHSLLEWDTVQAIMRSKKGEKRSKGALAAPKLLPRQLDRSLLPEGWTVDDPAAEDDWSHLPGVEEAFNQKLKGPREKNIHAKFVLFASPEEAEWELWRRKMEFELRDDLADRQPVFGDGSTLGKHSSNSYELLLRKGPTVVIFFSNSEDVIPIGQKLVEKL